MSLSQLGRARETCKLRFDAHLRADSALNELRRDIISITRSNDLFYTRFLLLDDTVRIDGEQFDQDSLLIFNTRLRPLRDINFGGEGVEYETHYRIEYDDYGPALWRRRDVMPDEYPEGGGVAEPLVEGIISLNIEAYDGQVWSDEWDSDLYGLPQAVRVTLVASGHRGPDDIFTAPRAVLRTIVPIDRVLPPRDLTEEELAEGQSSDEGTMPEGADIDGDGIPDDGDTGGGGGLDGRGGDRPSDGGGRGGGGRGPTGGGGRPSSPGGGGPSSPGGGSKPPAGGPNTGASGGRPR